MQLGDSLKCPYCHTSKVDLKEIHYSFFRHLDYETIRHSGSLGFCKECFLLFNVLTPQQIFEIDNIFRSNVYADSSQTRHTVKVRERQKSVTRALLQADLLRYFFSTENNISILDIGCFDGKLLLELESVFPHAHFHGYDINENLRAIFPKRNNFHFWTSGLNQIGGSFDLICLSHSMMYWEDLTGLMRSIKRLLKLEGKIFIQVPDITRNPCTLLLGDQFYYFTVENLSSIFCRHGFHFVPMENLWFPREIVGIAKTGAAKDPFHDISNPLEKGLKKLELMEEKSNDRALPSRVYVLGTTVNAAFIDSLLNNKMKAFVDENEEKVGRQLRSKPVAHPRSLGKEDFVVIPYGKSGQWIQERMEKEYTGNFLCI